MHLRISDGMSPRALALAFALLACSAAASATPACESLGLNRFPSGKTNKLYLYFPPADDAGFPSWTVTGLASSPAHRFDVAELSSYTGTGDDLQQAIYDVVADDYCEFNVEVIRTNAPPPTTFARRNTVAIGTDSATNAVGDFAFGQAEREDVEDKVAVDSARVWAGTYQAWIGGPGGALEGAGSTLARWANAIGGTAAHEAGHNYGMRHEDGELLAPGEDVLEHHLMAAGSRFSPEARAGYRRHFSDNEYSILAANLGLSVQTLYNWDFINPNMETAASMRVDVLSQQPSLLLANAYTGVLSPWSDPVVSGPNGTRVVRGVTYNAYQVTWSKAKPWSGGAAGQVAGGAPFHVGAGFSAADPLVPDSLIPTDVTLFDAGGTALSLRPRVGGFDSGTLDAVDGSFGLALFNLRAPALRVEAPRVRLFRRLVSIEAMVGNVERPVDPFGQPLVPYRDRRLDLPFNVFNTGTSRRIPIARLRDPRDVVQRIVAGPTCRAADSTGTAADTAACAGGIHVSLFPATATLVTVALVDPHARYWSRERRAYVVGPMRTHVYFQFAGRHPDLNRNGIDDLVEILRDPARDRRGNGVIDDARR